MTTTPAPVVAAIQTIAAYLRDAGYGSAIVAPTGGASFHLRNVLDEKADLFEEIRRLEGVLTDAHAALVRGHALVALAAVTRGLGDERDT